MKTISCPHTPKLNYPAFIQAVKEWQRANGATCTVCWQDNMMSGCAACGWWGKVPPEGFTPTTIGPTVAEFTR